MSQKKINHRTIRVCFADSLMGWSWLKNNSPYNQGQFCTQSDGVVSEKINHRTIRVSFAHSLMERSWLIFGFRACTISDVAGIEETTHDTELPATSRLCRLTSQKGCSVFETLCHVGDYHVAAGTRVRAAWTRFVVDD